MAVDPVLALPVVRFDGQAAIRPIEASECFDRGKQRARTTHGVTAVTHAKYTSPTPERFSVTAKAPGCGSIAGAGAENLDGGIDVRDDTRAVSGDDLPERSRDVRADLLGEENVLGDDDAVDQVRRQQAAVVADLVTPVTDLDPLGLRSQKSASRGRVHHTRKSREHLHHQRDSARTGQCRPDGPTHPLVIKVDHQPSMGKTNDGVIVSPLPVRRTAVPAV